MGRLSLAAIAALILAAPASATAPSGCSSEPCSAPPLRGLLTARFFK